MLTAQDIFDRVYNHFIVKRRPRSTRALPGDSHDTCAYRGNYGAKCAAGLFIPDHLYEEEMEGGLCTDIKDKLEPGCAENIYLLLELQRAHDFNKTHFGMQQDMEYVAVEYKLKVPNHETVISTPTDCT